MVLAIGEHGGDDSEHGPDQNKTKQKLVYAEIGGYEQVTDVTISHGLGSNKHYESEQRTGLERRRIFRLSYNHVTYVTISHGLGSMIRNSSNQSGPAATLGG